MQAVEYVGRVLADGHLDVPTIAKRELQLRPNERVKVILMREREREARRVTEEDVLSRERHEAWCAVMEFRELMAGRDFNLTDEIVRMREEEDV